MTAADPTVRVSEEPTQAIKETIQRVLGMYGPVLVAQLGGYLRTHIDPAVFKAYGGLRRFMNAYCADIVESQPHYKGQDSYVRIIGDRRPFPYSSSERASEHTAAIGFGAVVSEHPQELNPSSVETNSISLPVWSAFSSPNSQYSVWVNPGTGQIKASNEESAPWQSIPSLASADHRMICSDYLPSIPQSIRDHFTQVLEAQDFWQHWNQGMRKLDIDVRNQWAVFRKQRISEMFEHRLASAGVEDPTVRAALVEKLTDSLTETKKFFPPRHEPLNVKSPVQLNGFSPPPVLAAVPRKDSERDRLLRILLRALPQMHLEDLRRIQVPAGVLLDVMK